MKRRAPTPRQKSRPRPRTPSPAFPFTAIVGQEEMKLALLLNVIDASIGGVLIMGHRGTGKSTAVRSLADLLPKIERVRGCFYNCDPADEANLCDDCYAQLSAEGKLPRERVHVPVADLPLGATEDRVCGAVNIERALKEGVKAFEPGLLARANRGFLYIDEVNLLDDHLIDLLLDVSVTGRNVVEREGVSVEHPARFVLVGSGNPEEGELRPQLLDRFGLHVEVKTASEFAERMSVVEQREAFDRDPEKFRARAESGQESLRRRLARARRMLGQVELPRELLHRIIELCGQLKIDGHRGELTITRAARALAALEGRSVVSAADVRRVAAMALRHRLRRDPLEQTGSGTRIEQHLDQLLPASADAAETKRASDAGTRRRGDAGRDDEDKPKPSGGTGGNGAGGCAGRSAEGAQDDEAQRDAPPALDAQLPEISLDSARQPASRQGARAWSSRRRTETRRTADNAKRGRYVRAAATRTPGAKVALDATLRAGVRGWGMGASNKFFSDPHPPFSIPPDALRYKRFKPKAGTLFIFAVDASGSMALNRIAQAKGALAQLLRQSYIKRDRVALVSFRGQEAEVLLRPSGSMVRAKRLLDALGVGGATPLAAGLRSALEIAQSARKQGTERVVLLLFTDGRANISLRTGERLSSVPARQCGIAEELEQIGAALRRADVATIVVDTQNRFTSGGEGKKLAETIDGSYVYLPPAPTTGDQFTSLVRQARQPHS